MSATATRSIGASSLGARSSRALLGLLPDLLAGVAEAAWISVVAALLAAGAGTTAELGPVGFAVAALGGIVAGRRLGDRPDWPILTVALTALVGVAGWLVDPAARADLLAGNLDVAIRHNLGGWLAAVAFLRGSAHARTLSSRGAMETLLALALPGLAIVVLIGGALPDPGRSQFLADARLGIVLFLAAATAGVAVARLAALRGPSGFDWRRNRAWLLLLVVLVVGVSLIALPVAAVVGPAVQLAIAALFVPALVLGTIAGFRQISRRAIVIYLIVATVLIGGLSTLPKVRPQGPPEGAGTAAGAEALPDSTLIYAVVVVALALFVVAAIVALARLWARDVLSRGGDDVPEERWIDATEPVGSREPRRAGRRTPRRAHPATARDAYLAALEELRRAPTTARTAEESPAAHAARLRATGAGTLALDLLAADYELAVFADARLSAAEDRRAVGRYERIRRWVRSRR